ncbi:hypothetical protein [Candidatus Burkholderia verschuerenii]|jgi:hypothetical protein|nr:hypothetical protein [Candidatus Burkholderia verschuerenii]
MQKIERAVLVQAQLSGGAAKGGSATATASSPMTINLSGAKIG